MTALAFLRSSRRTSGVIVALLLVLGAAGSFHHHRLAAPSHATAIDAPSESSHPARSVECVFCRTFDPVRLVAVHESAPPVVVSSSIDTSVLTHVSSASTLAFSPRGPPAAA